MIFYRISKYKHMGQMAETVICDEWSSYHEIKRDNCGISQYLEVEQSYVNCITDILNAIKVNCVVLSYIEKYDVSFPLDKGTFFEVTTLSYFLRAGLKEKIFGRLWHPRFRFEFGYDYYFHIGCNVTLKQLRIICEKNGLYCEPWLMFDRIEAEEEFIGRSKDTLVF